MEDESRPINVNNYNSDEGKLIASIRWLLTRIYEDADIPDRLQQPFVRDEKNNLKLSPTLETALCSGFLYTQAAAKILRDNSLLTKSPGAVLKALSSVDIEVRDGDSSLVTEELLSSEDPFYINTHISFIDALMTAHMKSIISIERVVQAVSVYTSVDKREEPLDCVDALLFWINKICLLVRDDVERQDIPLRGSENGNEPTIPEMEDLYEDLCDGTCICALLAFYRPHEVDLKEVYFNDPISISDCRYNLGILKNFSSTCLSWNPFHFEIEDILYLHESLQPNVNSFLTDLFYFFEPEPQPSPALTSPTHRRFVPVQGIPELRAQNIAHRPLHPPKTNRNSYGSSQRDRTMSVASADSLMTTRSGDSLRYNQNRNNIPPGVATTNFGNLNTESVVNEDVNEPGVNFKALAEMRLAFEEKKREHEKKLALNSALKEEERIKMGKNAFFKLMSKSGVDNAVASVENEHKPYEGASTAREMELSAQLEDIREELKHLKVMHQQSMSNLTNVGMSHATSQPSLYNDFMLQQHQQPIPHHPQPLPNQFNTLPHKSPIHQSPIYNYNTPNGDMNRQNYGMPYSTPQQTFFPSQMTDSPHHYAMPNTANMPVTPNFHPSSYYQQPQQHFQLHSSNSQGALHMANQMQQSYQQQTPIPQHQYYNQPPHNSMSYSMYEPHQTNGSLISPPSLPMDDLYGHSPTTVPNANTFRLHQPYASSSRLDPPLELNRNLTNWGLTYRADSRPQRKTWAIQDPDTPNKDNANAPLSPNNDFLPSQNWNFESKNNNMEEMQPLTTVHSHQQSPPKDPDLNPPDDHQSSLSHSLPSTSHSGPRRNNSVLMVSDVDGSPNPEWTAEMEAKRQALLMNQMKRKEQSKAVNEDKKNELEEKIRGEQRKQDLADQRKLERELKRQKVLEDYKRRKMEQELGEQSGTMSARASITSAGALSRGHSQPPFIRPKSQSNMSSLQVRTLQRSGRTQSSVADENSAPKIHVPSLADPALKLYAKHQPKSNRSLIMNALQYSVFPGAVSNEQRNKVQAALAQSDSKHFLVLFRDNKTQYRGLYTWDQQSDTIYRIEGTGPKIVKEDMMNMMFKYDSGAKHFNHIPTKNLSATIDGFTVLDQFWQKPRIPHSRPI